MYLFEQKNWGWNIGIIFCVKMWAEFKNLHKSFALNMSTKPGGSLCYIHLLHSSALQGHFVNLAMCVKQNFSTGRLPDDKRPCETWANSSEGITRYSKERERGRTRAANLCRKHVSVCVFSHFSMTSNKKKTYSAIFWLNSLNRTICTLLDW